MRSEWKLNKIPTSMPDPHGLTVTVLCSGHFLACYFGLHHIAENAVCRVSFSPGGQLGWRFIVVYKDESACYILIFS